MKASSFISVIICSFGPYINLPLLKLNFSVASKLRETDLILVSLGSEQLKINVLSLFPPIYCEFISLISSSLHAKYFAAEDQNLSFRYACFVVWSLTKILVTYVLDKKPLPLKGSASKLITWSKAVRSNSSNEVIPSKARLPMCWRLFGKTNLSDSISLHDQKASAPISSKPSLKLMPIISLLVRNEPREFL